MSSTAPVTPAPIHPSWWARAGTWFVNEAKAVKGVILKITGEMPAVAAEISKVAPTVEALSNIFVPGSGTIEQHLLDVWGVAASAVSAAGDADTANGVNVTLDAALVADIKAILPAVQKFLHPAASSAPAPAPPAA